MELTVFFPLNLKPITLILIIGEKATMQTGILLMNILLLVLCFWEFMMIWRIYENISKEAIERKVLDVLSKAKTVRSSYYLISAILLMFILLFSLETVAYNIFPLGIFLPLLWLILGLAIMGYMADIHEKILFKEK